MTERNPEQQAVVSDRKGARCVIAGPGTGKTATMVDFFNELLDSGVPASNIRCVTFSKEAAQTIEKRAKVKNVFSTFHSLGYQICSETNRKPVEPELRHRLMFKLTRKWGLEYKALDAFIAKMRHDNVTPEQAAERGEWNYGSVSAYAEYERVRLAEGWMDFDCQPPGTLIEIPDLGVCPIEKLRSGDMVVSWNRHHRTLRHRRVQGVSEQDYTGRMLKIETNNHSTQITPNHWVWARFNDSAKKQYAIYLMWKSELGFRVGQCKFIARGYSNWPNRLSHQDADRMWVLSVTDDYYEALTREAEISTKYGIPQTAFNPMRGYPSPDAIRRIFASAKHESGFQCLMDFGRIFERPLLNRREKMQQWVRNRNSRNNTPCLGAFLKISASNLLPNIMSLPGREPNTEQRITQITSNQYSGKIYSLSIEKDHTYIADGLIVGNSMLCDSVQYLENPQNRARWQFEYLIVDEAQDTDDLQWRLMQLLSEKHGNITVVGDPNQAIYTWRGASPENLTHFEQWFPGGKYFYLGRNYRSTQTIVNFVRENAPPDCPPELLEKMLPARSEVGAPIGLKMYWTDDAEAESALTMATADPLNSIILARTNRMIGALERICNRHSIRYHLLGKSGFWKQNEIRKAIEKLKDYPMLQVAAAMNLVMPSVEAHYAVDDRTDRDNDALENLQVLKEIGKSFPSTKEFCVYANKMMHRRNDPRGVTISTIHQAKGSEFLHVFVIGARAGMIPHKNGEAGEEARIWFVAVSRAINTLRISFAGTPSPYLRKYLTAEILDKLRETATEVEHIQAQAKLDFSIPK